MNSEASVRELTRGRGESAVSARRQVRSVWESLSPGRLLVAVALLSLAARGVGWGQCTSGIETVAGLVALGDGGLATAAQLLLPSRIAVDPSGNLYITDNANHRVRKVSPSGTITTVAGNGSPGYSGDGGLATKAQLNSPNGVTVDSAGNLYIADQFNHRIRKVTPTGTITTVAGNGTAGYSGDSGPATEAQLNSPNGVAVDSAGNLYISDHSNHRIRRVTPAGTISTIAGTGVGGYDGDGGPAIAAKLYGPGDVAVDSTGILYIADFGNHRIRKVDAVGMITTVAGTGVAGYGGDDGPASEAQLYQPFGVTFDNTGNLYIADYGNHRIRKVTSLGTITTVAGLGSSGYSGDGGVAIAAQLFHPSHVATDGTGNLYIADMNNRKIRMVAHSGIITTVAGASSSDADSGIATGAPLLWPNSVVVGVNGDFYISDTNNHRIRKVDPAGTITTVAGNGLAGYSGDSGSATTAQLTSPNGVAVDSAGNLYIADTNNHRIRKVDPAGTITTVAGNGIAGYSGDSGPATTAQLTSPNGVAVDSAGNLYIADTNNHRIRKVNPEGTITTVAGNGLAGYSGDGGPATAAQLTFPNSVAVDSVGNLYIADTWNHCIRKVTPSGMITTMAGNRTTGYSGDGGPATVAQLWTPSGVAVDGGGNLYIADSGNNRIRKVSPAGIITTVAGNGLVGYGSDGSLPTAAQLYNSRGVAVDSAGNAYIADTGNHLVRRIRLGCVPEPAVAYRDTNSGIRAVRGTTGTEYQLGGLFGSDPGVGVDGGGRLVVAARDTFNSLWAGVIDVRNGQWSGWSFGGGLFQGQPGVGVVSNMSGSTAWIAVRDNWNSYWLTSYNPGTGQFGAWTYLAGIFTTDPAVAACSDGTVYVVGRDQWGSLWSRRYIPGSGLEPWVWGMGVTQGKPAVTCGRGGMVHIAVRDNWNSLWMARVSGNQWEAWQYGGGVMSGDPQIGSASNGTVYVTVRDAWGGVWYRSYDEQAQSWGGWTFTGGILADQAPALAGGALHVLGRDGTNALWRYDAGLNLWTPLGALNASGAVQGAPR